MGNIIKPIRPEEIIEKKINSIPDAMFQAVNELLARNWNGSESVIRKDDLLNRYFEITGKTNDRPTHDEIYKFRWLDFEDAYREVGWVVNYEQPSYGDSDFEPYYKFERKGKK